MGFLFFFSPIDIQWYLPFSSQGLIESNCRKLEGSSVAAFLTKSRDPKSIKWASHSVSYVWNPSEVDAESVCVTPVLLQPVCSTFSGTVSKAFLYICCTNVHFKDGESAFTCSCFTFSLTAGWNWSEPQNNFKIFCWTLSSSQLELQPPLYETFPFWRENFQCSLYVLQYNDSHPNSPFKTSALSRPSVLNFSGRLSVPCAVAVTPRISILTWHWERIPAANPESSCSRQQQQAKRP